MQGSNRFAERTQLVTGRPRCLTRSHYVLARWLDVVDGGRPSGRVLASVRKWIDHTAKKPLFRSPNLCSVSRVAAKGRFSRRRRDFLLFDPKRAQHTHTIPSFLRGRYNIHNIVFLLSTRYTKASNGSTHKTKVANHFFSVVLGPLLRQQVIGKSKFPVWRARSTNVHRSIHQETSQLRLQVNAIVLNRNWPQKRNQLRTLSPILFDARTKKKGGGDFL